MNHNPPNQSSPTQQEEENTIHLAISNESAEDSKQTTDSNDLNAQTGAILGVLSPYAANEITAKLAQAKQGVSNFRNSASEVINSILPNWGSVGQGSSNIGNEETRATERDFAQKMALLASKQKEQQEQFAKDEEMAEKEQQKEFEEKRKKLAEERRRRMSGFIDSGRKQEEEWKMGMREANRKMEEKQEELKEKLAKEAVEREKEREMRFAEQEKQILEESRRAEEELERIRVENDRIVQKKNEELAEKQREHEVVMEEKEKEMVLEKEKHEENLRRIQEEYEKWKAETSRKWEDRQRKMNEQYEQLRKMLQMRVWNSIIETNWTNRLNFLRSANKEVARCFSNLQSSVHLLKSYCLNEKSFKVKSQKVVAVSHVQSLMDAVGNEKQLMEKESATLETMFENTGKQFLCQIRKSVDSIVAACSELNVCLAQFLDELNQEHIPADSCIFKEVCVKSRVLEDRSSAIPTLAELKERFREQMNYSEDSSRRDNGPVFQTVIIEEVD